jgi:hypothetical protein
MTVSASILPTRMECVTQQPTQSTRLGDVGYVDKGGTWRRVVNIIEPITCEKVGMKAASLSHDRTKYVTERKHAHIDEPLIKFLERGKYEVLTPEQLVM